MLSIIHILLTSKYIIGIPYTFSSLGLCKSLSFRTNSTLFSQSIVIELILNIYVCKLVIHMFEFLFNSRDSVWRRCVHAYGWFLLFGIRFHLIWSTLRILKLFSGMQDSQLGHKLQRNYSASETIFDASDH